MGRKLALAAVSTLVVLGLAAILAEVSSRLWLRSLANDEQRQRYGSFADAGRRASEAGPALYKYEPHRYLGYLPAANYARAGNRHNELGYRGRSFPREKPEGEFRVVCLGGSTTYTSFVEDAELSYPSQLEAELRRRGSPAVRVVNAGVEGWTSYETLINFQLRVLELEPDLIVVYHAVNDASARLVWPPDAYRGDNSGAVRDTTGWYQELPLWDRSLALRMLRIRLGKTRSPLSLTNAFGGMAPTSHFWHLVSLIANDRYPDTFFEQAPLTHILATNPPSYFRRNLENLVVTARHHGVAVVLATVASAREHVFEAVRRPSNLADYAAALDEHNQIVREVGAELGAAVYDFAAAFPADPELFHDPVHVNEEGARRKAEHFAEYLAQSDLLAER